MVVGAVGVADAVVANLDVLLAYDVAQDVPFYCPQVTRSFAVTRMYGVVAAYLSDPAFDAVLFLRSRRHLVWRLKQVAVGVVVLLVGVLVFVAVGAVSVFD